MSLDFMDNFSTYGTDTSLLSQGLYVSANLIGATLADDPDGSPGKVLRMTELTSLRRALAGGSTPIIGAHWRAWAIALPGNARGLVSCMYIVGAGNEQLAVFGITSNGRGRLILRDATNTAIDYDTPAPIVTAAGWWDYEIKYNHTAANTCDIEVRVEGQTVLELTAESCRNIDPAQVTIAAYGEGSQIGESAYYKDFVTWNGLGSDNNDFLGSVLVVTLLPASDISLNWTPSTGTDGYSILDNVPPNDAQYISAVNPPPAAYVGSLTNLPPDVTSVRGLQTRVRAQKSDGGDGSLQVGLISAAATDNGADRPITTTMNYWCDISELDPNTGDPWTPVAVDAAQITINRTT